MINDIPCNNAPYCISSLSRRVHISSVTASFLSDEFELEPGEGELREDGIRAAGLKTFLIKSVLKAVSIDPITIECVPDPRSRPSLP